MLPRIETMEDDPETENRARNIQETIRHKRWLEDNGTCRSRCELCVLSIVTFIFKLQELAIVFLIVLTTAGVSLASSVATGDAHLAMFYAVFWGTLVGSLFLIVKICIRARMGKAWVDVEVNSSNLVLLLLIIVALVVSILSLMLLDQHCTSKTTPCNLEKVFTFND